MKKPFVLDFRGADDENTKLDKKNDANDNEFPFLVMFCYSNVSLFWNNVSLWHHHKSRLVFISSIKRLIEYIETETG
jgi:hypothetical protein